MYPTTLYPNQENISYVPQKSHYEYVPNSHLPNTVKTAYNIGPFSVSLGHESKIKFDHLNRSTAHNLLQVDIRCQTCSTNNR